MEFNATLIVSMISFIVFVIIMNRIFYAPITKIVEEREKKLKENYDDADWYNQAAEGFLKVRNDKLLKTEEKSRSIIADKIETYNNQSKKVTTEAAKKSVDEIKARKEALNIEQQQAEAELKTKTQELAQIIASKIMGHKIDYAQKDGGR